MALATRTDRRSSMTRTLWDSSVGKKTIMAVSGLIMLGYLVVHMLGNLKIFFGSDEFNHYAHWLRTLGEPFLHYEWALWIVRVVLVAAVVLHAVSAYQLSRRDIRARPNAYVHRKARASYATRTMRWGGIILALFIVWHILDLTTGTVHPGGFQAGHPYQNVLDTFSTWYGNVIYIVAVLAVGLHVQHGFWSAAQTLGVGNATRDRMLKTVGNVLAVVLTAGFVSVPVAVMTGVVN
ncbi:MULTISPECIES: succinate dehydrogenase [Streptomyces]|uniref:Succinate dehydrogenase / fumarate reductase cytochrome b subunit n=1 Tax=Streptomyces clavifer TaxID=68188 RepID=A0ABS4VJR5_9ACTN|nr:MULTISPECIES: succinate dehydrogenase [Streptomyces]MBP2364135.1 succinate dehydrogenase / fumarate reductase cytochrome b subunit [Streptomyces clavifer]MDX2744439.1 succinate dehydrogenase [Streptomyces sp. NRRL_B-2557]MDX3066337.1 succinate dehydrogenase [Streptomyces sp. ND04-05B]WRY85732.1 succinate dehydrogenase [Streptomyces clavifer]WUC31444.1 succinate dehydrogenase [Streptomyces clavifer]